MNNTDGLTIGATTPENIIGKMSGLDIVSSPYATREIYRFKKSRNRSRRVHKKLTLRLGYQIATVPDAYVFGGRVYAHPEIVRQIRQEGIVKGFRCDCP